MGFRHVASTDVKIAHQVRGQIDAGNCREPVLKFLHSDFECLHHSLLCFNEVKKRKHRKVAAASEVCSRVLTLEANFSPSFGFQINFKRWSSFLLNLVTLCIRLATESKSKEILKSGLVSLVFLNIL